MMQFGDERDGLSRHIGWYQYDITWYQRHQLQYDDNMMTIWCNSVMTEMVQLCDDRNGLCQHIGWYQYDLEIDMERQI